MSAVGARKNFRINKLFSSFFIQIKSLLIILQLSSNVKRHRKNL